MNDDEQEYLNQQEARNMRATAQQVGMQAAAEHKERTVHNAQFLNELRDAGLDDSELYDWLTDEHPEWFSGAHAVSNRPDDWDMQADLLMMNKRERAVAEQRPGRLLRDRPFLHAVMTDKTPSKEAFQQAGIPEPAADDDSWARRLADAETPQSPLSSEDKSRLYGAAEVAADLMALSAGGAGLESVSTVKTETSVRREEEDESTASRVGRVLE